MQAAGTVLQLSRGTPPLEETSPGRGLSVMLCHFPARPLTCPAASQQEIHCWTLLQSILSLLAKPPYLPSCSSHTHTHLHFLIESLGGLSAPSKEFQTLCCKGLGRLALNNRNLKDATRYETDRNLRGNPPFAAAGPWPSGTGGA